MAQLSDAQVVELRERYAAGETQTALADAFGIGQTSVSAIVKGRTRAAAGGPIAAPAPRRSRGESSTQAHSASSPRRAAAPLTVEQVATVKERVAAGEPRAAVAAAMGISKHTVDAIMAGRRTGKASAEQGRVPAEVVARMREMHDAGATQSAIAIELGMSQQRVSQVLRAAR